MIYMKTADGELRIIILGELRIIILESASMDELKKGRPAHTADGSVLIAWTPDPVWLADRLMDSGGDSAKIAAAIDEASKRPEKPAPRPHHKPHLHKFGDGS